MTAPDVQRTRALAQFVQRVLSLASADVDDEVGLAAHLAAAIQVYRRERRRSGLGVPVGLDPLEQVLAVLSSGIGRSDQGSSNLGDLTESFDPEGVLAQGVLLTRVQAAARARCSTATLDRRVRAGQLPVVRHGGIVRFRAGDLDNLGAPNAD